MSMMRTSKLFFHYLFLLAGLAVFSGPLLWLLTTMLKTQEQTFQFPPKFWPDPFTLGAFSRLFDTMPLMGRWIVNSFAIAGSVGAGTIVFSSLIAFGFARTKAVSRNYLFGIVLATLMIPAQVTLIPLYLLYKDIGWYNTWLPLIVPQTLANPYFIFLFRQFFMTIPRELDEATYVDGGSSWTIYRKVIMPLSGPIVVSAFIFSFVFSWTDFFSPLIFIQSEKLQTLSVGLQMILGQTSHDFPVLAAGSFIALLPIGCIYFFAQRYFIEGVVMTGIK
ncbi:MULTISPECIES: carbohydrate ABC transporter permease [unclassified Paenibacillus]|uniref:carbohydrate ABC transporter permease n=1 Tax=unclassified Paenibacillus TaxID=185978 RepID=UPI0009551340|nr:MULTISPECIES: carbohydrate ABC transporter permease [unclassified Paenibacillus]ASS69022.1 carbohydrate ABC transporter permease [Paenibacillus sp. RUD330]SIR10167.1 multiple sugar transport system permease protein/sn-glycerol 3-phosphate transport system permease protein [Paenibacillus sp. RU4X]SIR26386.1 multiple sugar transport system permease protein/sn-glycerol 3-phosphate transport system permease protein [Paenibacillus sp. RU4T]